MDVLFQDPFQTSFKDLKDESLWSSSPSTLPESRWPQMETLPPSTAGFQFPLQQTFQTIDSPSFMSAFSTAFTPGASPLLTTDSSPFLPTLYPVKVEPTVIDIPTNTESQSAASQAPFPTPDPSPQLTPSPRIKPAAEQPGSINALMKEIQAKSKDIDLSSTGSRSESRSPGVDEGKEGSSVKEKKHACSHSDCGKIFTQKTHLDIHLRSHSGLKPFACPYPPCPSRFTQLGNLKTHIRRHTGEKPFACDLCEKRFAQRGNVRSHRATVHASREEKRMFECRLEGCGKLFSQRGNLKGHMERFHADAINDLTMKFSGIHHPEDVNYQLSVEERDLWDYLREMYKHSNKGIKGRGKDRKVMAVQQLDTSTPSASNMMISQPASKDRLSLSLLAMDSP